MVRTTRDLHISIVSVSVLPLSQSAPVPKYSITELPPSPCAFFEYNVGRLWGGSTNLPRGDPTRNKGETVREGAVVHIKQAETCMQVHIYKVW